ncbi:DUF2934 domain-containing protein [Paracoccus benzoatiresistens]|uniref:DUF2934 domain-containing protein n=1 Tax=Paracoccus benzoatiresistens TaxID=2997341 RepID=A0ABT4J1C2_9RHOB|nr:DUF2934 domain-containing protein [Paracoccus sp. EF6]MCZ0960921.1 DUF2934 domain-containing protein [Paracoccus sp. EF6]
MATDREERIRQRAHQLWEEQGRPEGKHAEHWQQASSEVGEDDTPAHQLQQDPPEGDRDTIESELARRQYDELENGKPQG